MVNLMLLLDVTECYLLYILEHATHVSSDFRQKLLP